MNTERKTKWPKYDVEVPEKILAIVYGVITLGLLIYAVVKNS